MKIHALLREVSRNLTSGTSRLGAFFSVAAVSVSLILLSDVLTITRIVDEAIEYRGSGSAVVTLAVPGRINGESCEALTEVPNVLAAGAMRESGKVSATTLPGEPLDLYTTTPTFAQVLGADDNGEGVYVPTDVATSLGAISIPIADGPVPVRGIYAYPPDGRRAGFGWAVLSPTSPDDGVFDECWALAWPQRTDLRQLMLSAVTPATGGGSTEQPQVSQLNTKYGLTFAGTTAYQTRITQYAPHVVFLIGLMLGSIAVWNRRVEIASNLHAGGTRGVLYLQQLIETIAWSLPAAAAGWLLGFFASANTAPTELTSLTIRSAEIVIAFFAGTLAGAVIGFASVREGRLWRYVKGR